MDTSKLTPEERQAIAQLIRSPGWFVIMREFMIPQMQQAADYIERPGADPAHTDYFRGMKRTLKEQIEQFYKIAELPNPFEKYTVALLTTLENYTTSLQSDTSLPIEDTLSPKVQERPRRVSYPV